MADKLITSKTGAETSNKVALSRKAVVVLMANGLGAAEVMDIETEILLTGVISAFADHSGTVAGTVKATNVAHGLSTNDEVTILTDTNGDFDDTFTITKIDNDNFYFTATFTQTDTATWTSPNHWIDVFQDGVQLQLTATNTVIQLDTLGVYRVIKGVTVAVVGVSFSKSGNVQ